MKWYNNRKKKWRGGTLTPPRALIACAAKNGLLGQRKIAGKGKKRETATKHANVIKHVHYIYVWVHYGAKSLKNSHLNILYRTRAIISRDLYNFYPIFHCGLYSKAANITDNLCTKQGNSSKKSTVYNQERFQIKSVRYLKILRQVLIFWYHCDIIINISTLINLMSLPTFSFL